MRYLLLSLIGLALPQIPSTQAQPQWRFHLAFEDGAGARDTLWWIYDTTATEGWDTNPQVDEHLGEGAVEMDPDGFNVWTWNAQNDPTRTCANPFTVYPYAAIDIMGSNCVPPMVIRWDRDLFNLPDLPIDEEGPIGLAVLAAPYFFWTGQAGSDGAIDMFVEDSVVGQIPEYFFQMAVFFMSPGPLSVEAVGYASHDIILHPNPASDRIAWGNDFQWTNAEIRDAHGALVQQIKASPSNSWIDIHALKPGSYFIVAQDGHGQWHQVPFIKQ